MHYGGRRDHALVTILSLSLLPIPRSLCHDPGVMRSTEWPRAHHPRSDTVHTFGVTLVHGVTQWPQRPRRGLWTTKGGDSATPCCREAAPPCRGGSAWKAQGPPWTLPLCTRDKSIHPIMAPFALYHVQNLNGAGPRPPPTKKPHPRGGTGLAGTLWVPTAT